MAKASISILGLYNYDDNLFNDLVIPQHIDKQLLIDNILLELSEFEVLYPNWDFMKFAIGRWSKKELPIWEELYLTTQYKYNPINNYDRTEVEKNTETRDLTKTDIQTRNLRGSNSEIRDLTGTNNQVRNLSQTELETRNLKNEVTDIEDKNSDTTYNSETSGDTTNSGKDTSKEFVFGFNSGTASQSGQTETELGTKTENTGKVEYTTSVTDNTVIDKVAKDTGTVNNNATDTGTINNSLTDKGTISNSNTDTGTIDSNAKDIGTVTIEREHTVSGNIGVTTTQQMIKEQRDVVQFNVIDFIVNSFKNRFCLLIYNI